jgi:hypothetical protein
MWQTLSLSPELSHNLCQCKHGLICLEQTTTSFRYLWSVLSALVACCFCNKRSNVITNKKKCFYCYCFALLKSKSWGDVKVKIFVFFVASLAGAGNSYWRGRLCTVDLLIKVGCFVKQRKFSFSLKSSWFKLVSTRRSTVLTVPPFQLGIPGWWHKPSGYSLWLLPQALGRLFILVS